MILFPKTLKNYNDLRELLEDIAILPCDKCKMKTIHLIHGWNGGAYCLRCTT
jgi:hypothetical protein